MPNDLHGPLDPAAVTDLAAVWLGTIDQAAVTAASHQIDLLLQEDADAVGQALYDTVRSELVPPLGADFDVLTDTAMVYVLAVWDTHFGRPAPTGN